MTDRVNLKALLFLTAAVLLTAACDERHPIARNWNEVTGAFTWYGGQVTLPPGFYYEVQPSDTLAGSFISLDGNLVIEHDIGGYAGIYADRRDSVAFRERTVQGTRTWLARRPYPDRKGGKTTLIAVTFPDSGCANFFLTSTNPMDAVIIEAIAASFRPNPAYKSNSDCR